MSDKIEFPWESEIPLTCRKCDRAKYAYALAHEVYRLRNENEAIRAAMREAMRLGGDKVVEAVRKWMSACFKECDDLSETVRGAAGFGSTGV